MLRLKWQAFSKKASCTELGNNIRLTWNSPLSLLRFKLEKIVSSRNCTQMDCFVGKKKKTWISNRKFKCKQFFLQNHTTIFENCFIYLKNSRKECLSAPLKNVQIYYWFSIFKEGIENWIKNFMPLLRKRRFNIFV